MRAQRGIDAKTNVVIFAGKLVPFKRPMDLVGRHVVEFVGIQRFEQRVKPNLDRCFAGELVDYTFAKEIENRTIIVRCRMTP